MHAEQPPFCIFSFLTFTSFVTGVSFREVEFTSGASTSFIGFLIGDPSVDTVDDERDSSALIVG